MKTVETYRTRDGKVHGSIKQAESHSLANAHNELKALLDETMPALPNTYGIAQAVVMKATKTPSILKRLRALVAWLEDSTLQSE